LEAELADNFLSVTCDAGGHQQAEKQGAKLRFLFVHFFTV
jgi:hypothetical protein